MHYKIQTKVTRVERRSHVSRSWKQGEEVVQEIEDLGWFVVLEGSRGALFLGMEKPNLSVGQEVDIIIRPRIP